MFKYEGASIRIRLRGLILLRLNRAESNKEQFGAGLSFCLPCPLLTAGVSSFGKTLLCKSLQRHRNMHLGEGQLSLQAPRCSTLTECFLGST